MPSEVSSSKSGSITASAEIDLVVGYMKSAKSKTAHVALLEKTMPKRVQKLMFSELVKDISKRFKRNSLIVTIVPIPDPDGVPNDDDEEDEVDVS